MTPSHNEYPQASREASNNGSESDWRYSTAAGAWGAVDFEARTDDADAAGPALDPLMEELQHMGSTDFQGLNLTTSSYARSVPSSLGYYTPAASTEASDGSAHDPTSSRSDASWQTFLSPSTPAPGSHDPAERRTSDDYAPVATGQALSRSNYAYLEGEVTYPTPIEVWQDTRERHEELAYRYRLGRPSAPAPAPASRAVAPAKKHRAGAKRH
jgi:hypothetical protein